MKTRDYVPSWGGNRDRDEADQMVVTLAPMTGGELRKVMMGSLGNGGKVDLKKAQATILNIIETRIVSVTNCVDILDEPIVNGTDVIEKSEQGFIDELYSALTERSTLSEGLKKS